LLNIALENLSENRYRKLVISENVIVGAILLGYPQDVLAITHCISEKVDVSSYIDSLCAGNWEVLQQLIT